VTDPLLTIEDATREYRVSPKTIRRRLGAGEIEGAYKRPGQRGPEWVIPRGALEAAGFVRRAEAPATELPEVDSARADYWERRALDAEAALRAAKPSRPAKPASDVRVGAGAGSGNDQSADVGTNAGGRAPAPGSSGDGPAPSGEGTPDAALANATVGAADDASASPRGSAATRPGGADRSADEGTAGDGSTDVAAPGRAAPAAVPAWASAARRPATLTATDNGAPDRAGRRRGWVLAGVTVVVIALFAGVLALGGGEDDEPRAEAASGPAASAQAVLATLTAEGDAIGVIGTPPGGTVPDGRRTVPVARLADEGGRYVLVASEGGREPGSVGSLRRSASVVLDLDHEGGSILVLDTGAAPPDAEDGAGAGGGDEQATDQDGGEVGDGGEQATTEDGGSSGDEGAPPAGEPAPPADAPAGPAPAAPAVDEAPEATPGGTQGAGPSVGPASPTDPPAAPSDGTPAPDAGVHGGSVVVDAGESFWTIAVELVEASGGGDLAEVTSTWSALIDANADRLVEPGNPDLLHIGQTLLVPGG